MNQRSLFMQDGSPSHWNRPQLFIALWATEFREDAWQILTPRVMSWAEGIWVMDLAPCYSYWEAQAQAQNLSMMELLQSVLTSVCSEDFIAVASDHPWPALVLLTDMRSQSLCGFISTNNSFGHARYKNIRWSSFWEAVRQLGEHYGMIFPKRWRAGRFKSQCMRMRQTMRKLNINHPHDITDMDPYAIRRRYGATLRDIWGWTFLKAQDDQVQQNASQEQLISEFPWQSYRPKSLPSVSRHLDESTNQWEQVDAWLREDLERLCCSEDLSRFEKVTCLEWRLTLDHMIVLNVPIMFRHPHSLHHESPHFATARLQASYSFHQHVKGEFDVMGEEGILPPLIVSWQLVVSEKMTLPDQFQDILGDVNHDLHHLMNLENRLSRPLSRYSVQEDWLPEDSYQDVNSVPTSQNNPWSAQCQRYTPARPPLMYKHLDHYEQPPLSSAWRFLERSMCKWWQSRHRRNLQRDYYCMTDHSGRSHWVFKDSSGRWYRHGIFA